MKLKKLAVISFSVGALVTLACKSEEPAQQGGYPQQTQPAAVGQPPAQPGYAQPAPAAGPATAPAATAAPAPAAAPAAPLSAPGPLALPCTSDAQCVLAHCNTQFGKCVFPCQNDNDCIAPNRCQVGACLPAAPGQ
jgi:hypothetical protein